MPNLSRIQELVLFDFYHAFTSMKSTIFIIPYFLFWYLVFANVTVETLEWLQSTQGLFLASYLLDDEELALQLLIDRSATLSVYLLISVAIMPLFILFASNNQLSSDRARGAFRFVLTRTSRTELFLARFISSLLVAAVCILITSCWALVLAWLNEEESLTRLLSFSMETLLLLLFYCMPFVAFMSMTSALAKSAIGNLFMAMMLYVLFIILIFWLNSDISYINYLLPSAMRPYLYEINAGNIALACAALFVYTLIYIGCGWLIFQKRDV